MPPSGLQGRALLLFPGMGVSPCRFYSFPIPHPMDEVHGGIFIRFAEVLVRCLCFHFFTYVVHAVSENHVKFGTWAVALSSTL